MLCDKIFPLKAMAMFTCKHFACACCEVELMIPEKVRDIHKNQCVLCRDSSMVYADPQVSFARVYQEFTTIDRDHTRLGEFYQYRHDQKFIIVTQPFAESVLNAKEVKKLKERLP